MHRLAIVRPPREDVPTELELGRLLLAGAEPPPVLEGIRTLALATDEGRNLFVAFQAGEVILRAERDDPEVDDGHGGTKIDDDVDELIETLAYQVLEALQHATGWYTFGDYADDFVPGGSCSTCKTELFAWQLERDDVTCPVCGGSLQPAEELAPRDASDQHAKALADRLLELGWVELVSEASRSALLSSLAACLAHGWGTGSGVLEALIEQPGVAEVYADEEQLTALIASTAPSKRRAPSTRRR